MLRIVYVFALALFSLVRMADAAEAKQPNIVFVLCDDLRWDTLGCAGHPYLKTPNIDRLAAEGVRFANAFCTTSLCSPSRASILTGLYAHNHGVRDNFTELPAELPTFPKLLHVAGYETAYLGKWHMGEDNDEKRPGFDYFVTHKGQGKYFDTEFNVDGERRVVPGYYTTVVTDLALQWMKRPRTKPFLMFVGQKAPHSFYTPEPKYEHTFDDVRIEYPKSAFQLDDKPTWIKDRLYTWHGIYGPLFEWRKKFPDDSPAAVKDFAAMQRAYWGTVQSVDDSVGRLVAQLKESGKLDETIFVFMGDNGLLAGEHGMVDKRTMHEASIRIPLIVRYPGLTPTDKPQVCERQVLTLDVANSMLELAGAAALPKSDGRSWVRLVRDGTDPAWRNAWFYEYNYEKQFPYTPNVRGLRTERWKYMHYPHGDGRPDRHKAELYDLAADPEENKNLIDDPARKSTLAELQAELARLIAASGLTDDKMPLDEGVKQVLPDAKIR
ncbi:MAG: sulfatase [Planctomycetes bacterium]|nr:sulfatase [Planctomycetota bacterium]